MQRVLIAATGTGVGKTHLTSRLARELRRRVGGDRVLALKPVESGEPYADSQALEAENMPPGSGPRYRLRDPISPHLAARRMGVEIELPALLTWVAQREQALAIRGTMWPHVGAWSLIETAGGIFSPLAPGLRNFELLRALDPALWVLVAPDRLGVLHDVSATLTALEHLGRPPDLLVLSAPAPDASTGTNAAELANLGIAVPALVLDHGSDDVAPLVERLLARG